MRGMNWKRACWVALLVSVAVLLPAAAWADWLKMDPPPDVDKSTHGHTGTQTCWIATAANMLAGAGYGTTMATNPQARADAIYNQLFNHYYTAAGLNWDENTQGGWVDDALSWWLANSNDDPSNDYDNVTLYGNKTKTPWNNANGAQFIANELRRCQQVGVSISWVNTTTGNKYGGHAITAWGDNGPNSRTPLTYNPSQIMVTDSDRDTGGDVQTYNDIWKNGAAGNGWYPTYSTGTSETFIKHIVTLCGGGDRHATGTTTIHQGSQTPATDLHYVAYTDVDIRSYKTDISWPGKGAYNVVEDLNKPGGGEIKVDWTFDTPVPYCTNIDITTEFTMDDWNAVWYKDVYFTYPDGGWTLKAPSYGWQIESQENPEGLRSGGYVVGAFDLMWEDPQEGMQIVPIRLEHEFGLNDNRENHLFRLINPEDVEQPRDFMLTNVRFGFSEGYLGNEELAEFREWMVFEQMEYQLGPGQDFMFPIEFPYLEEPEPEFFCEIPGDLNLDGYVGAADLDIVRGNWGEQVPPGDLMRGDPSGDGYVGAFDLDIVRANWGTSCPNDIPLAQVPEPATFVLLGIGMAVTLASRRRTAYRTAA